MSEEKVSIHGMWSSRLMFILAAAGSAVGLGNLWRFPYVAGESGGGAFVLVYLVCIGLIGIPIMMSEVMIGRAGRQSPIHTMADLAARSNVSPHWRWLGWMGALAGFLILSFYGVIAGWATAYIFKAISGSFVGLTGEGAASLFTTFTSSLTEGLFWQGVFMVITIFIVARGVGEGLEQTVKLLMPALFLLFLVLLGYAMTTGHFGEGLSFLFSFKWEDLTTEGILSAMGQAFFTLSLGMGAIMAYGAYMPKDASIASTVSIIALMDTGVAILAGMVIFPIVFANGLEASQGPGLMFISLPLAFGSMSGGSLFGCVFFTLVFFAAITSAISIIEPAVAWLVEYWEFSRPKAAILAGAVAWVLGLGTVLSFNVWSDVEFLPGRTFFDSVDYLTNNVMLPLGGLLIAIFAGWVMNRGLVKAELDLSQGGFMMWQVLARFVAPAAVFIVFVMAFF